MEALHQHKTDRGASPATLEILELKGGHLLGHFGTGRLIDTISYADTAAYVRARRRHVTDSTIEKELRQLTAACRVLGKLGAYSGDPKAIWPGDMLRPSKARERWLTVEEFEALFAQMQPSRRGEDDWSAHLAGYVYTGARLSELYALTASDLYGAQLHIRGTKTSGADRVVDLSPSARAFFSDLAGERPDGPLYPVSRSMDNQARAWAKALTRACERLHIPHASTNDLRRTFCSWACQAGVPMWLVLKWMGHGSDRMVKRVYAQSGPRHGEAEAAKLPAPRLRHTEPRIDPRQSPSERRGTK